MSFGVRVFDTVLNKRNLRDTVSRNASSYWKEFCLASCWSFSYERIHSISDLQFFLSKAIKEDVLIFSGHGNVDGWHMTNGEVFTPSAIEQCKINKLNFGKTLIFSSCLLGNSEEICNSYKELFGARNIFAYRHEMEDRFCFLNESILLTLMQDKKRFSKKSFESFQKKTGFMKNLNQAYVRMHPMVMY